MIQSVSIRTKNLKREITYETGYEGVDELTVIENYDVEYFCVKVRRENLLEKMIFPKKSFVLNMCIIDK